MALNQRSTDNIKDENGDKQVSKDLVFLMRHWKTIASISGFLILLAGQVLSYSTRVYDKKAVFDDLCKFKVAQEELNKKRDTQISLLNTGVDRLTSISETNQKMLDTLIKMHMRMDR
jgi:hypothetical protein